MLVLDESTLRTMLAEDAPYGDLTTRSLSLAGVPARMEFRARNAMTVCGLEEAARLIELSGGRIDKMPAVSGDTVEAGGLLLVAQGPAPSLFLAWKVSQTLVEWASGLATAARAVVTAAMSGRNGVSVACTRKTVPGTRAMSLKAVTAGGASIHRTGLSDTLLLFPEHQGFADDKGMSGQIAMLKAANPERTVVVEVKSHDQALAAAHAGADVVQLEKFTPQAVNATTTALASANLSSTVAAAGGINPGNAADYARAGAAVLVTSWPYTARPADVAVTLTPA